MIRNELDNPIDDLCNPTVEALIVDNNQGDTMISFDILVDKIENKVTYVVREYTVVTFMEGLLGKQQKTLWRKEFDNYFDAEDEYYSRTSVIEQVLQEIKEERNS